MSRRYPLLLVVLFFCLCVSTRASAVLTIEITGGVKAGMPIAVVPFEWRGQGAPPVDLRNVIAADLHRSGRFDILPVEDFLSRPSDDREVRYKDWRLIKAEALVVGQIKSIGSNRFEVRFQLFDVFHEKHHHQGFLGSELAWDLQIGGPLHQRAVIFVIMTHRRKIPTW